MDRLKFRVWSKSQERFLNHTEQDPMIDCQGDVSVYDRETKEWHCVVHNPDFVVQQCTGVKDINGELIYEGDICKAKKPNSYLNNEDCEIRWDERGRWVYFLPRINRYATAGNKTPYQIGCQGNSRCEIIGNIFIK